MGFNTEDSIKAIWGPIQNTAINPFHQVDKRSQFTRDSPLNSSVFAISGRLVRTLGNEKQGASKDKADILSAKLPNGVYFYSFITPTGTMAMRKLVINR